MINLRHLNWPLIIVLGLLGLARPLTRIILEDQQVPTAVIALGLTLLVTVVWALGLGLLPSGNPFLAGIATGLVYALGAIVFSGILSPILLGHLASPLTNPIAIVPLLLTNALWGAIAGGLALLVRRLRWGPDTIGGVRQRPMTRVAVDLAPLPLPQEWPFSGSSAECSR